MDDTTIMVTDNSKLNFRQLLRKYELAFSQIKPDIAKSVRAEWKVRYGTSFDDAYEKYVNEYNNIE